MRPKIKVRVKSREGIESTFKILDETPNITYVEMLNNKSVGQLEIPDWFWTTCEREIEVTDTSSQSHQYDFNFFDYPEPNEERNNVPVVYYMKEWLDPVNK